MKCRGDCDEMGLKPVLWFAGVFKISAILRWGVYINSKVIFLKNVRLSSERHTVLERIFLLLFDNHSK
jgi:hypothetical protein